MSVQLKKLDQQVMVITGASSGIGLVTARAAVKQGARVVLAARNEDALQRIVAELNDGEERAAYAVADVGVEEHVQRIAATAQERFGGFDTWVNNAGVSIYGKLEEVSIEDERRLFETNFWGVVYGSLAAAAHLKTRPGGALINIGSTLSDRAIPLQGMYCASKHAVKAFTETLRMELEQEHAPISVTLVKPASIDTMFIAHAKNYLSHEPRLAPPLYAPEVVAEAILHAAQHPVRDVFAGGAGKLLSLSGRHAPRITDKLLEWSGFESQKSDRVAEDRSGALYRPTADLLERHAAGGRVFESSLYTRATLHPAKTSIAMLGAGLAAATLWRALANRRVRSAGPPR